MALFGKKEELQPSAEKPRSLLDMVLYMQKQGYSKDQVVEYLQKEGYGSSQIFDALSQADMKSNIKEPISGPPSIPEMHEPSPISITPSAPAETAKPATKERIEELVEVIIEEKWSEIIKNVNKVAEWKDRTEDTIAKLEQQMKDLKSQFDSLHEAILAKIGDYHTSIMDVGTDVKAMGEVFKKVLPTLTENVGELSRLTKKIKSSKKK